jgi:GTP-binding protein HflX
MRFLILLVLLIMTSCLVRGYFQQKALPLLKSFRNARHVRVAPGIVPLFATSTRRLQTKNEPERYNPHPPQELNKKLADRARQFYDSRYMDETQREKCILLAVEATEMSEKRYEHAFSLQESLSEMSELVGTAGLVVAGSLIQRLPNPHPNTYIGSGKIKELVELLQMNNVKTVVVDDDLNGKQQRHLEDLIEEQGIPVKIIDRTAIILEIFAQHAHSREGQLQVELAMMEYRKTRGPKSRGLDYDQGAGFRGPGEKKLETDRRVIRDKIVDLKREIENLGRHRQQHRKSR